MARKAQIGTVSYGTLRPEDLIPAFFYELEALAPDKALALFNAHGCIDANDGYDTEDADYLLEDLFEALDDLAPEGCYFGAIEGDGADFGFWPCDDEE